MKYSLRHLRLQLRRDETVCDGNWASGEFLRKSFHDMVNVKSLALNRSPLVKHIIDKADSTTVVPACTTFRLPPPQPTTIVVYSTYDFAVNMLPGQTHVLKLTAFAAGEPLPRVVTQADNRYLASPGLPRERIFDDR